VFFLLLSAQICVFSARALSRVLYVVGDGLSERVTDGFDRAPMGHEDCQGKLITQELATRLSTPGTRVVSVSVAACGAYLESDLLSGIDWISGNADSSVMNIIAIGIDLTGHGLSSVISSKVAQVLSTDVVVSVAQGLWDELPNGVFTVPVVVAAHPSNESIAAVAAPTALRECDDTWMYVGIAEAVVLGILVASAVMAAILARKCCRRYRELREDNRDITVHQPPERVHPMFSNSMGHGSLTPAPSMHRDSERMSANAFVHQRTPSPIHVDDAQCASGQFGDAPGMHESTGSRSVRDTTCVVPGPSMTHTHRNSHTSHASNEGWSIPQSSIGAVGTSNSWPQRDQSGNPSNRSISFEKDTPFKGIRPDLQMRSEFGGHARSISPHPRPSPPWGLAESRHSESYPSVAMH
jgi:hypothetical protein